MSGKTITVKVLGKPAEVLEDFGGTIQDAMELMELEGNYTASVNGNPALLSAEVVDMGFVTLTPAVKGAQ